MLAFSKFILVLTLIGMSSVAYSQKKTEDRLDERKLLEKSLEYLEKESKEYEKAYEIGHNILQNTKSKHNKILSFKTLSLYHYYKYTSDSAIFYANKGLELTSSRKDSSSLKLSSRFYLILSQASRDKGLIEDSKKWALKGIEIVKAFKNKEKLIEHELNLARTYRIKGNTPKALELFKTAAKRRTDPAIYTSIAICYLDLKKFEQALFYHKKTLKIYDTISTIANRNRKKAVVLLNIGAVYSEMHKNKKALSYFNKSLEIAKAYNYPLISLNDMLNIGVVLEDEKEFTEAKNVYKDALSLAKYKGYLKQQSFAYQRLKEIAVLEKNYKDALRYTEKNKKLNDSIGSLQKDEEIAKLEIQYETLKKEKEISNLKKDQQLRNLEINREQSQKKIMLFGFIIILIPLTGMLVQYYQKLKHQSLLNQKQKELGEQKIEALIRNQELKLIRNSINAQYKERKRIAKELHDRIGGNLAAIKLQFSSIKENKKILNPIYHQIDDTYQQVRVISHDLIPKKFNHNDFTQVVKEYMNNIGEASNLTIHISTYQEDEINRMDLSFHNELFSVFQELITNTIKHANANMVEIQIDFIYDHLNIIFEDNGKGFNPYTKSSGIGLSNIENRVKKLSGHLNIDSNKVRGTIVRIEIPI